MAGGAGLVKGLYEAFARGDVGAVLDAMHPAIEWTEAEGFPYHGTYRGPEAIVQGVFARQRPGALLVTLAGLVSLAVAVGLASAQGSPPGPPLAADSVYRLTARTLEGKPADLGVYAGKVALVVNVASRCGYTPQYAGLERLYAELRPRGLVVLGFPSNDFGGQEPGTAQEIRDFCSLTYDVSFPMFDKVVTRPGAGQSPVYATLHRQSGELPRWNFSKYLVGRDGRVVRFYPSEVRPDDPGLRRDIETALAR